MTTNVSLIAQCQFNLDSYTHVNCYSENTGTIDNMTISNIVAFGLEGSSMAGNYRKSHKLQNHLNGYHSSSSPGS